MKTHGTKSPFFLARNDVFLGIEFAQRIGATDRQSEHSASGASPAAQERGLCVLQGPRGGLIRACLAGFAITDMLALPRQAKNRRGVVRSRLGGFFFSSIVKFEGGIQ